MNHPIDFAYGSAICYSGYRQGQSPRDGIYPSHRQIAEDLRILAGRWRYLRIYDSSRHAELVLEVIRQEQLDFKVMLGADVAAESNNPNCPWGCDYPADVLERNRPDNDAQIDRLIELAKAYPESVFSVSVGNEAAVDWSDHLVPVERLLEFVRRIKRSVPQPVTFCDNYAPWHDKLKPLAAELDFISLHTYPAWENKTIDEALSYTQDNYAGVTARYPDKPVIITEAGWTTAANDQGIGSWNASEALQDRYCSDLLQWCRDERILTFLFEAFDEPWKGSPDPADPEKHWGLFTVEREPKPVMARLDALLGA